LVSSDQRQHGDGEQEHEQAGIAPRAILLAKKSTATGRRR
jgi:hypothetical protein